MSVALPPELLAAPFTVLEPQAHGIYQADFGCNAAAPRFGNANVIVNRKPHFGNPQREHTYWHLVTEGENEATRTPEAKRMRRLPWVRPILVGYTGLKVWSEMRGAHKHWNIWHTNCRHVVIIKELARGDYLLVTSYPTDGGSVVLWHRRFNEAKKMGHALEDMP